MEEGRRGGLKRRVGGGRVWISEGGDQELLIPPLIMDRKLIGQRGKWEILFDEE